MADWKIIPRLRTVHDDLEAPDYLRDYFLNHGIITKHEADELKKWYDTINGHSRRIDYDSAYAIDSMADLYNYFFNDNLTKKQFDDKFNKALSGPVEDAWWLTPKKTITLSKIPKIPKVPTKKLLKELPPEYNFKIPPKMMKSNAKLSKEIDDLIVLEGS